MGHHRDCRVSRTKRPPAKQDDVRIQYDHFDNSHQVYERRITMMGSARCTARSTIPPSNRNAENITAPATRWATYSPELICILSYDSLKMPRSPPSRDMTLRAVDESPDRLESFKTLDSAPCQVSSYRLHAQRRRKFSPERHAFGAELS